MSHYHIVEEPLTCCGDVVELVSFEKAGRPSFSLCKFLLLDDTLRSNSNRWVYALMVPNDKYPILISDACMKSILEDPDSAFELVFNRHFDRYH